MEYISERIVNIGTLESLIQAAYTDISMLRKELEKESPSMDRIDGITKELHLRLLQAKDFEFYLERRKAID